MAATFDAKPKSSLEDMVQEKQGFELTMFDESAQCTPAFKVLRLMVSAEASNAHACVCLCLRVWLPTSVSVSVSVSVFTLPLAPLWFLCPAAAAVAASSTRG